MPFGVSLCQGGSLFPTLYVHNLHEHTELVVTFMNRLLGRAEQWAQGFQFCQFKSPS